MAHGILHGPKHGVVHGVKHGGLLFGGIAGVSQDAAAGKLVPATNAEWTTFMTASGLTGNPTCIWGCQDANTQITDANGVANLSPTPVAPAFRSTSPGWSRFFVRFTDGTANQRMLNNATAPDPSTSSVLVLMYVEMPGVAPASSRGLLTVTGTIPRLAFNTTNKIQLTDGATNDLVNTMPAGVRLIWYQSDVTNSISRVFTETEVFTGSFTTPPIGPFIGFGGVNPTAPGNEAFGYIAEWSGAAAEKTVAQIRTMSQNLGWSVAW